MVLCRARSVEHRSVERTYLYALHLQQTRTEKYSNLPDQSTTRDKEQGQARPVPCPMIDCISSKRLGYNSAIDKTAHSSRRSDLPQRLLS
ncbi:hypothetical protein BH10CHL1_BH10CHL1_23890 [soil metagenome]